VLCVLRERGEKGKLFYVLEPVEGVDVAGVLILLVSRTEVDDGRGTASGPIALHVECIVIETGSVVVIGPENSSLIENQFDVGVEDIQLVALATAQIEAGEGGQVGEVDSTETQHARKGADIKEEVLLEEVGCHVQKGIASFRGEGHLGWRVR